MKAFGDKTHVSFKLNARQAPGGKAGAAWQYIQVQFASTDCRLQCRALYMMYRDAAICHTVWGRAPW
jgi:hypothetical protein